MKVSEAIEKLTNKRNDALSFMSDIYKKGDAGYLANEIRVTTYNIAINTLQQIDEPQAEKVEVTQEFADWFEKSMMWKHNGSWAAKEIAGYGWGAYMHDPETGEELLPKKYPWVEAVQNNKEKHIKAIYDGYTVKPKRWVVEVG